MIVQLRAVFCPSVQYLSFVSNAFFWQCSRWPCKREIQRHARVYPHFHRSKHCCFVKALPPHFKVQGRSICSRRFSVLFSGVPSLPPPPPEGRPGMSNVSPLSGPAVGLLRTQKLKSHLVRTQSLNVLPLKPGVGQYIAIYATLTIRDFFLAYFYPFSPLTRIFSKTSPDFSCVGCCLHMVPV